MTTLRRISVAEPGILQHDRVHVATEGGFERRDVLAVDIEVGNERAGERRSDALGIVQSLQDRLRTLGQAFAFFIQLPQNLEPRLFFGRRFVRSGKLPSPRRPEIVDDACSCSSAACKALERLSTVCCSVSIAACARSTARLRFIARGGGLANFRDQLRDPRNSGVASGLRPGEIVAEAEQSGSLLW